jgi:hypothetical protein
MTTVNVRPLPNGYLKTPAKWRPMPAPIFDGEPSREDLELALALIEALDDESRAWYVRSESRIRALLANGGSRRRAAARRLRRDLRQGLRAT